MDSITQNVKAQIVNTIVFIHIHIHCLLFMHLCWTPAREDRHPSGIQRVGNCIEELTKEDVTVIVYILIKSSLNDKS